MIVTSVPASKRRPNAYSEYKFVPAGQQLVPLPLRVVAVGVGSAAGTAAIETPVQVFDEDDADTKAGRGSDLALMLRKMFEQSALQGASPEIWAVRIAAPAGVAAANTITVTGPATASGTLTIRVAGRPINVGVSTGDAAATIASAIKAQLDTLAGEGSLPGTAGVAGAVVTLTHPHAGVTGNDVVLATESPVAGVGIAYAQSVAGTGVVDITAAIDSLYDKQYDGIAIANHAAADIADLTAHLAAAWGYSQQKPRHFFVGERGSLGTALALATAANDKGVIVLNAEGTGSTPGEVAAAGVLSWFAYEEPNINMDGQKLALYAPIASLAYTDSEIESALAGGVTPLVPTADGFLQIERLTTTATTIGGQPSEVLREPANSRTAAYMGRQIAARFASEFRRETLVTDPVEGLSVLDRIRDMVISVQRAAESLGYIRDVDEFLDQVLVEEAINAPGRVNVTDPFRVAGPLHQAVFVHTMYL